MEMEMGWTGLLDESFASLRSMLDEGEGEDDLYSTIGANGGTLEALFGYSQICPNGTSLNNVGGTINAFHHLDCSITTSADTPDPEGSDELGLLQRRDGIESGLHKNGGKQKLNGVVGEREVDAPHDANNKNNNGYANAARVGRGRKNGFRAKNLMAERRRRKKLNDRLFMLRSMVPKVSKMDRTSTLADAVEYMKELLQRIKDLHTELMSGSSNLKTLLSTLPDFSWRMNQGYQASLLNPELNPAKVDVRAREGKSLNIHMFCSRNTDLLLSTIRTLDGLGLEIKHATISYQGGFSLDVFQAEQSTRVDFTAEEIKALLLHIGGYVTGMYLKHLSTFLQFLIRLKSVILS